MTTSERAAFDALRVLVGVLDEQTDAYMLALREDSWDCGDKLMELSERRISALIHARATLALENKADAEPQEPVVRLTLEQARAIRNGWNATLRSEQCTLCLRSIVSCRRCKDDGELAAAGEEILAAAIKTAEGRE